MPFLAAEDQVGKEEWGQRGNGADRDPPLKRRAVDQLLGGIFDLEEDATGSFHEGKAGLGEHSLATQPMEKFVPQFLFKLYNLLAQRRLSHIRSRGGTGEIARVGDGQDVA